MCHMQASVQQRNEIGYLLTKLPDEKAVMI